MATQQSFNEINYRAPTNSLTINLFDSKSINQVMNVLSFRTNEEGLFKLHKYNVLLPFESLKSMELPLKSDLPNAFCIDVVFLTTMQISQGNQAFKIEIKNAQKIVIFNENIITRRKNEWTTARIFRNDIKLRKDWTITLTAHTRELVIGGIKFCKEGFTVYKPKIENPNHCQSLVKETDTTEQVAISHVQKIWSELIDCNKLFGEDCSGTRLCYQEGYCACFAGYQGNNCAFQCHGTMFGLNCSQFTERKCFNESFSPINGTCREGCAAGYSLPDCIDECTGDKYGKNCHKTSTKKCLNNEINHVDGKCLKGCADGYYPPICEKACTKKKFGPNCSKTNDRKCFNGNFSRKNGSCLDGCIKGYVYPECQRKIQTVTPKVKRVGYEMVTLDLLASLNGTVNISQILIEYEISSHSQDWANERLEYLPNELKEYSISNLKSKTQYTIRFTLFEKDAMKHTQNFLPGNNLSFITECKPLDASALTVQAVNSSTFSINMSVDANVDVCTPKYLTVVHNAIEILNETMVGANFVKFVHNCQCGEHRITVAFVDLSSTLHEMFLCSNCPTIDLLGIIWKLLTPIATVLAVLAVVIGLGVWFYTKKWKKNLPLNQLTVQFSNTSEILRNEILPTPTAGANKLTDNNREIPLNSISTDVERYLQKALTFNLKKEFEKFPLGQTQSWNCGSKSQNKRKNRYANLAAYDCSRVVLDLLPGDKYSDYINANYVDGFERPKAYIATQGPKLSTVNDFWRMIWQENISLIVMVTNLVVGDKKKCEKYWPDVNREESYGNVVVRSVNEEINANYVTRTFSISRDNAIRLVQQLHYTSWPDQGVPLYPQSMALFIGKINQHRNKNPILIHCSGGVGKTGTVILIDACLQMFRSHNRIDVMSIFTKMRSQRVNLVNNLAQYEFVHLVLLEIIANPKFEIDCANFDEEYCQLMSYNREWLKQSFVKLEIICEKDFQRLESPAKNDPAKCRYPHFISSSNAIIRLLPYENVVTTSFINAVIVDGYNRAKQFIVTQVPMKNTVEDFWRMIDQFNVKQIVVLNEPHTSDAKFLPSKKRKFAFGDIKVTLADSQNNNNINTLDIKLLSKEECKKVRVMCASFGWMPQQAAPPNMEALINLWGSLKIAHEEDSITIVCHDGVTASGLFLAMGFVIEKIKLEQKVDAGLAVRTLRKSRPAFVSSDIQFAFLYEAALHFLNSFDTYGNFKC
ncbi:receptor-type tyrosine-protein phosphatase alpha-like [Cloeon dipterum]|uniref:receptor-type tyrosine-protein phosphatase alpha-like n=1 Tax=Cloeon dipterum TaxID=197152 RepID=UPI003220266E